MGNGEIKTLTGLRGYAALGVCVFHYTLLWQGDEAWLMPLARHGNYGVPIFFVLSGFILSYVYRDWFESAVTWPSYLQFIWHRFARVYPLHLLLLVVAAVFIAARLMPLDQFDTPFTFLLNVFLLHGWGYPNSVSWNSPSWTISVEFFAYLLFPFVALVVRRGSVITLGALAVVSLFGDSVYRSALTSFGVDLTDAQYAYGLNLPHYFGMFLLGMLAFEIVDRDPRKKFRSSSSFDLAVIVGGAWLIWEGGFKGTYAIVPISSAVLIAGLYGQGPVARWLAGNPAAVFLGDISFSLYLSQGLVQVLMIDAVIGQLGVVSDVLEAVGWNRPFAELPLAATVATAIVFAAALHYGFERPMRRRLRFLRRQRPAQPAWPLAAPIATPMSETRE